MNICIFCGSNPGNDPVYQKIAKELIAVMAEKKIGLVYGGAKVGIMGLLADEMIRQGGEVHGVIPKALIDKEVAHRGLTSLREVSTMHERKQLMFDMSDAFITFPGGFGTLDETFEIITWKQIDLHKKPLVFLDVNNFYSPLIDFIDSAVSAGFIRPEHRKLFLVAKDSKNAVAQCF